MPPKLLFDISEIDLNRTAFDLEGIRKRNSQRFEMEMLDRIIHFDPEQGNIIAERTVKDGEFWARGHFPGQPVFPGVLMIESAGQMVSFFYSEMLKADKVLGFAACEDVKFRGMVTPGDTITFLGKIIDLRTRISSFHTQGLVNGELRFQAKIVGMPL